MEFKGSERVKRGRKVSCLELGQGSGSVMDVSCSSGKGEEVAKRRSQDGFLMSE